MYRRERVKNVDEVPVMDYRPIRTMNNTAWQTARKKAGLGDLHVHDLRHTVGMRLREAAVPESTSSTSSGTADLPRPTTTPWPRSWRSTRRWRRSRTTVVAGTSAWRCSNANKKRERGMRVPQKSPSNGKRVRSSRF